ncbi:hypothetical protein Kuja_0740 [Vibrio phage vB_VchM_Kuja]|uniref:Uncharacterized protein n=1 Tax=Vibrio phage vB_VchM_Kuja TaxID=2686437 RepID=A0A6B9J5G5_9CAUD|nr:hypothetical protein HWC83_gp162 [Vibrio phage vB_VchM_Kuja]QGZ16065.1 hypothetical protein Kuja_0740 [Vibrio phage vB_VchM_Kuja]
MPYLNGQELFEKTTGQLVFFDRYLDKTEMLISKAVTYMHECPDSGQWEEPVPSVAKYVVARADYTGVKPKECIPKYLANDILNAEEKLRKLEERCEAARKNYVAEREAHANTMKEITERAKRLTPKRKRQIELVLAHLEGVDLYVMNVGSTSYAVKRLSEFKGDYGARMLGLHGDFRDDNKKYDWHIHQYSDDSGSWTHCLVAQTMEELKERALEYKKTLTSGNDWRRVHFLKFLVERFQYELTDEELSAVQKADKEKAEAESKQRDKQINSLVQQAEILGYVLHPLPQGANLAPKRPEQPY